MDSAAGTCGLDSLEEPLELKSDPAYDTVNVTDIDIAFPGDLQTYTLREGVDSHELSEDREVLTIRLGIGGVLEFYLPHAHWSAIRQRTIRVLAPVGPPPQSADPQTPSPKQTEQ
jgi:hypothetical protein